MGKETNLPSHKVLIIMTVNKPLMNAHFDIRPIGSQTRAFSKKSNWFNFFFSWVSFPKSNELFSSSLTSSSLCKWVCINPIFLAELLELCKWGRKDVNKADQEPSIEVRPVKMVQETNELFWFNQRGTSKSNGRTTKWLAETCVNDAPPTRDWMPSSGRGRIFGRRSALTDCP